MAVAQRALIVACQNGHVEVATVLLGTGAAVEKANNAGQSPFPLPAKRATPRWSPCCWARTR